VTRPLSVVVALVLLSGCASWPKSWGPRPCCIETKPLITRQPVSWHLVDVTLLSPFKRSLQLGRIGRRLFGLPVRALNLQDGHVPDSAFFTNRDPARLSPEDMRWGPTQPVDLAQPPLTITKPKTEGKTPGFFIKDARGVGYLFKLDPVDAPELLSGAEVVTSKLLFALGYHVPSYEIVVLHVEDLTLGPGLTVRGEDDATRPFTEADLQTLVEPRVRNGTLRVVASKLVEGEVLGPAKFKRFRDCAEIRALKVAYAWVNNTDAKDHNSLLVWDGTTTRGYLIDFGTSLGADAGRAGAKAPCAGWTNVVDLSELTQELFTLGLHRSGCRVEAQSFSPAVGLFTAQVDPDRWKPYAPNLAFNEMNEDDASWIAARMAALSQDQIGAAVSAGQYSNSADAAYLVEVLEQRRRVIVAHYLEEDDDEQEEVPQP